MYMSNVEEDWFTSDPTRLWLNFIKISQNAVAIQLSTAEVDTQ
jgi:hypothetical protein